jgi:seryl-tRNA synthetase
MSGDPDLIGIRGRRVRQRPLSKIMKIQAEAQDKYQKEIFDLEKKRGEAQQRINELQHGKDGKQKYILSSQQIEEIKKYRTESAETAKKLKQTRKDLRKEIESLQTMIQAVNSFLIPALVILAGLGMWLKHHTRKRSK